MKIIMSRNVIQHSGDVANQVVQLIDSRVKLPDPMDHYEELAIQAQPFKHLDVQVMPDSVSIEVSDDLVIAVLKLYGKVATTVSAIVMLAKPLFAGLKDDVKAINDMAAEQVI